MRLSLAVAPAEEPVTLAEAKAHLRAGDSDDTLITSLIVAAREIVEGDTGRQLITAQWKMQLDRFPALDAPIEVERPPLISVQSVTYIDSAGTSQTWASSDYTVDVFAGPMARKGLIYPNAEETYPATRCIPNAVTVNYTAGYGAAADVPDGIKALILLVVGDLYENRESQVVGTIVSQNLAVRRLTSRFRVPVIA